MVGFRNLVGTGIAPVSKKTAVKIEYLPWTTLFIGSSNYAGVGIDFGTFRRCNFVQADFAVKFVARYLHIVRIQLFGTSNAFETTFMESTSP